MKQTLLILFIMMISVNSFSIDKSEFEPATIAYITSECKYDPNLQDSPDNPVACMNVLKFIALGRSTKNERKLTENNKKMIEAFSKSIQKDMVIHYDSEVEFIDNDGKTYWIPIQKEFHEAFRKEVLSNGSVKLFLAWVLSINNNHCVIMLEFEALNPKK
jgi:hypothetical protein